MLELDASVLDLSLKHPVTITRGTALRSSTVLIRLRNSVAEGIGESAPIARYGETVASVCAFYTHPDFKLAESGGFDEILAGVPPAARCGLDVALYDLLGKQLQCPLWYLFGLDPTALRATSFTIFIDTLENVLNDVKRHRDAPILKVKLGLGNEIETLEAIRSVYTGTIRVDANEGWTPVQTVRFLREFERFDIEFCEQPIPAGEPEQLRWIKERSPIPIVADEDSRYAEDLGRLIGCVDGVNVKLAKCGGIRAATKMIHAAKALGFKVMLGCMTESSVLITAAGHLAPMADWLDLDGNLLLEHEPFAGMTHANGNLTLPTGPGLGIRELLPAGRIV